MSKQHPWRIHVQLPNPPGVGGEAVKAAFLNNLMEAEDDFTNQGEAVQRTVAYYMTLGDVGSRNFVQDAVYNTWAVNLDNDYRSAASHLLSPYGNLDNDGQFNIEEWQESGYDVEAYLARILDDERAPDESLLDPQAETFVETCDYCTKTEIVFGGGSTAGNFTSGYEPDYELIVMIDGKVVEEETEVALGRWIDIVVQPTSGVFYGQGYQFNHWSAPGNLLNGERSERARFMLMPPPSGNTLTISPGLPPQPADAAGERGRAELFL